MKRIFLFLIAMSMLVGCYDVVFEPIFDGYEEVEGYVPYDKDVIPSDGDTCWFYCDLQRVMVKAFDPSESIKPYRWEMHIDGNKYGETKLEYEGTTNSLFTYEEAREWWRDRIGTEWAYNSIFFDVPSNNSPNDRRIEIVVSLNESFYEVSDEWGEWFSVFDVIQKGN